MKDRCTICQADVIFKKKNFAFLTYKSPYRIQKQPLIIKSMKQGCRKTPKSLNKVII